MEIEVKICTKCKEEKELNQFYNFKSMWCKRCHIDNSIQNQKKPYRKEYLKEAWSKPGMIFSHKKANAKKEAILFNITKEQFISWYIAQKLQCSYCGLKPEYFKMTEDKHLMGKINLGLDRVDNNLGYEISNIVLCCNRCNSIKGEFFTREEMRFIGSRFVKPRWRQKGISINRH